MVQKLRPVVRKSDLPLDQKWLELLKHIPSRFQLQVVSASLAILVSNAHVERVLSHMGNTWTDNRNSLLTPLVKAELCAEFNY